MSFGSMCVSRSMWTIRPYKSIVRHFRSCQKIFPPTVSVQIKRHVSKAGGDDDGHLQGSTKPLKLVKPKIATVNVELTEEDNSSSSSSDDGSSSDSSSDDEIDPKLVSAVDAVAESIKGDKAKTKSDLLDKLQDHVRLVKDQKQGLPESSSINSLISGLKVKSSRVPPQRGSLQKYIGDPRNRSTDPKQHQRRHASDVFEHFKLFQEPALGIFSPKADASPAHVPTLFDEIQHEELQQSMSYPPVNAFEEMITWTNEGKLWQYPIDNEQGLDEEAKVGFHEHVFLGHLLNDFPKKGPVRHFMELVTAGLSANPYLTVAQKHEHIAWYKEYFNDKYELIDELTVVSGQSEDKING